MESAAPIIRDFTQNDIAWAEALVADEFASPRVVSRGRMYYVRDLRGLVAEWDGRPGGLLQYRMEGSDCEIVILVVKVRRRGLATRLVQAVRGLAGAAGCRRLWLVTTNDNLPAIEYYQKTGWTQAAVHPGAVHISRQLKPEIPEWSASGIPMLDELEFEMDL